MTILAASCSGPGDEHFEQDIESPSRPLQPAEDVAATVIPSGVEVTWSSKVPPGDFVILRRQAESTTPLEVGEVLGGEDTTEPGGDPILRYSFVDTRVISGVTYVYGIRVRGGPTEIPLESEPVTVP
jgi:hypothetical protein